MSKEEKKLGKYKQSVVDLAYGYYTDEKVLKLEKALRKMPKSCIKMLIRIGQEEQYKLDKE